MSLMNLTANGLRPEQAFRKHLANASSASEISLAVDGSTPVNFRYTVPSNYALELHGCLIGVLDGGHDPSDFGFLSGSLTNGLEVKVFNSKDSALFDFLDGQTIQKNGDFAKLVGDEYFIHTGSTDDHQYFTWDLPRQLSSPLILFPGDYFNVKVQDDLSGLTDLWWILTGRLHKVS